jgi:hypothetical protein
VCEKVKRFLSAAISQVMVVSKMCGQILIFVLVVVGLRTRGAVRAFIFGRAGVKGVQGDQSSGGDGWAKNATQSRTKYAYPSDF